ncbi:MAG: substrate-binding domain-containing protein [Treponema sp.]|jgi:inositol transport system substrate-binding protein|nr:substrate-binding domain-containing protein [Treponema sp.]
MKKSVKSIVVLAVTLVLSVSVLSSCKRGSSNAAGSDDTVTIGVSLMNLQVEFSIVLRDAIQAKADELGITVIINDAQGDASKQLQQVESFIVQGVNGIILQPQEQEASAPCIDKAKAAGIPIVNVNSHTITAPDAFVGSDDRESAEIALNYINERLSGKGNILMMHGHPGQTAEIQRTEGAMAIIDANQGLVLLDEQTATWDRARAMTLMENWIQKYGNQINAVFGQNDEMALGAANALVQAGMKERVVAVGVDAVEDALLAVKAGTLDATVFQDGVGQGMGSVETVFKLVKGESVPKSVLIPFILVTTRNVDDYL